MTKLENELLRVKNLKVGEIIKVDLTTGVMCAFGDCPEFEDKCPGDHCSSRCDELTNNPFPCILNFAECTVERVADDYQHTPEPRVEFCRKGDVL